MKYKILFLSLLLPFLIVNAETSSDSVRQLTEDETMVRYYYRLCLGREPENYDVIKGWAKNVTTNGQGRIGTKQAICTSPEGMKYARKIVTNAVEERLKEEHNYDSSMINKKQISIDFFIDEILKSAWFKLIPPGGRIEDVVKFVNDSVDRNEEEQSSSIGNPTADNNSNSINKSIFSYREHDDSDQSLEEDLSKEEILSLMDSMFGRNSQIYKLVEVLIQLGIIEN